MVPGALAGLAASDFHHVGIACSSLDAAMLHWMRLGYSREGEPFEDSNQGIAGQFMVGGGPRIELLEPLKGSHVLDNWLQTGMNIYHFAYFVVDLDSAIREFRHGGATQVREPRPAVAFSGCEVAFLMFSRGWLIELIGKDTRPREVC